MVIRPLWVRHWRVLHPMSGFNKGQTSPAPCMPTQQALLAHRPRRTKGQRPYRSGAAAVAVARDPELHPHQQPQLVTCLKEG